MPETKGHSLEHIERLFENVNERQRGNRNASENRQGNKKTGRRTKIEAEAMVVSLPTTLESA
jgi:hypothetical protein